MPSVMKLIRYMMSRGESVTRARHRSCSLCTASTAGARRSNTSSVIATANTPSLRAASRSTFWPAISLEALAQDHRPDDPALRALARIVHSADFKEGLAAVPEAAGLLAISQGFPLVARDDLDTVERAAFLYDALYAFLQLPRP